jgi:lathosterol oxidase
MENIIGSFSYIFLVSLMRYFLIAGVPFILCYYAFKYKMEIYKIQNKVIKKKDIVREIVHSTQTTFIFTIIAWAILFSPLNQYTLVYKNIDDFPYWWIIISLVLSLIIHDTYFYWMHRLLHHKRIYKYTHVIHHKSTNPSPWTSYSFHILEAIAEGMILLVLAFILPLHQVTMLLFTIIGFIINVYGHLGYEIAPKKLRNSFIFKIINTSVYHNLHHSQFNGNYGLYFRFWDRIMKTENPDYVKHFDILIKKRSD